MLEPSVDNLLKKVNSKYALVTVSAKRARELHDGDKSMIDEPKSYKNVGVALEEILEDKLTVEDHE